MKILIVSQYFWPESFKVNDLSSELVSRGHDVTIFTGLPNYPQGKFFRGYSFWRGPFREEFEGAKIIRIPIVPRGKGSKLQLIINFLYFGFVGSFLAPLKLKKDYDVIFIYGLSPIFLAIPGIIFKKFFKIPVVFWVTDLWPESLIATGVVKNEFFLEPVKWITHWIYKNCDLVLTSSVGFIKRIESYNIPKLKIKFWPQWAESFFELKPNINNSYYDEKLPLDGFKILFAGNLGKSQDIPTILKAAERLIENSKIKFIFLGDGIEREQLERTCVEKKLKNVFYLGRKPIESMPYYYSNADVLLVSLINTDLFSITIPSKVQTYMASSKPILASLNGEGAELINEWKAGLSVPASDPEKLSDAILKFSMLSEDELNVMKTNSYQCYKKQFDRKVLIDNLEEYLNDLM